MFCLQNMYSLEEEEVRGAVSASFISTAQVFVV